MFTKEEWYNRAIKFDLGLCPHHNRLVYIESRGQSGDMTRWVVYMDGWVLGRDGDWHYEPLPSSRTDEFITLTRFSSPNEAHDMYDHCVTWAKPLTLE